MTTNTTTQAPALTKAGKTLLTLIATGAVSFFDDGITEGSNTWHDALTEETAGAAGMPKTAKGVSNVIRKLAADGYLTVEDAGDGEAVYLTAQGAETAQTLRAQVTGEPAAEEEAPAKLPSAAEMRKAIVATGELTRSQVLQHKGEDLAAAYRNLVLSGEPADGITSDSGFRPMTEEKHEAAVAEAVAVPEEKPAKKTAAKKETAAKKPAGPKDDAITRHITEVFRKVPSGTFLTFRQIIEHTSKEFPKADGERPGTNAVYSRCHGGRLPAGLTGQNKPCGATKN